MTFGDRLKALRLAHGWTQEFVAQLCGIRGQTVWRYERAGMMPSARTAARLARIFGVRVDDLLGPEDD